jgi:hypothetical protein
MKLSCLKWSGVHLSKGISVKNPTPKSSSGSSRSSDARGAASTGTRKASNASSAKRQGDKAAASKANNSKKSTLASK